MMILTKAETLFNNNPMSWINEYRDVVNRSISTFTMLEILEFIVLKEHLNDITAWNWEELYGYYIQDHNITLITSCEDPRHIVRFFDNPTNQNIDDFLRTKGYVAITAQNYQ